MMNVSWVPGESGQYNNPPPQPPQIVDENRTSPSSSSSTRTKSVATACERCRKRKIRCDGGTPCSTCRRFLVVCKRPTKSDTHALEHRVRQLEAQIVDLRKQVHGGQTADPSSLLGHLRSPSGSSSVTVNEPFQNEFSLAGGSSPVDVPEIKVVDFADSSPTLLSTSPMLHPLVTTFHTAMPGLRPTTATTLTGTGTPAISPPVTACSSPGYDVASLLIPINPGETTRSRSSSLSSLNLDAEALSSSPSNLSISDLSDINFGMNMWPSPTEFEDPLLPFEPSQLEAETFLEQFFHRTSGSGYGLGRQTLMRFLHIIESNRTELGSSDTASYDISMARFHVYMAMAVALRMEQDTRSDKLRLLYSCYQLAVEEIKAPSFWLQPLAREAAVLLILFVKVSRGEEILGYG